MSIITDEQEIMEQMYDRLESRDWWFVIDSGLLGDDVNHKMINIEEKYYPPKTELSRDFELMHCFPLGAIYIFKKQRIDKKQLEKEFGVKLVNAEVQDIIMPRPPNSPLGFTQLDLLFHDSMSAIKQARSLR